MIGKIATFARLHAFLATKITRLHADGPEKVGEHHQKLCSETIQYLFDPFYPVVSARWSVRSRLVLKKAERLLTVNTRSTKSGLISVSVQNLRWQSGNHLLTGVSSLYRSGGFRNILSPTMSLLMIDIYWSLTRLRKNRSVWDSGKLN